MLRSPTWYHLDLLGAPSPLSCGQETWQETSHHWASFTHLTTIVSVLYQALCWAIVLDSSSHTPLLRVLGPTPQKYMVSMEDPSHPP